VRLSALQNTIDVHFRLSARLATKQFTAPSTRQESTSTESLQNDRYRNTVDRVKGRMSGPQGLLRERAVSGVREPAVDDVDARPTALNVFVNIHRTE